MKTISQEFRTEKITYEKIQQWQVLATLKQLYESMNIVKKSKNLSTIEGRITFGIQKANELKKLEAAGYYKENPPAEAFIKFFENDALKFVKRAKANII